MLAGTFWHEGRLSAFHIVTAFSDLPRLADLSLNSAIVACGAVMVSLTLGAPVGFLCFRTDLPFRRWIILACILASCIPLYISSTCWLALFGMHFWLNSSLGAAWITGIAYTPLVVLLAGTGFASVEKESEEAAALHADRKGVILHATIPGAAWAIIVAAFFVAILSLWDITVTDILMVRTFAEEVFTQFQLGKGPWGAAAISLPMIAILSALWLCIWRLVRNHGTGTLWGGTTHLNIIPLGRFRIVLSVITILAATAFFLIPLGALIKALGTPANLITSWHTAELELISSLQLTPIAATLTVCLAAPTAWLLVRSRRWRIAVAGLLLLLLSVPAPVAGIGIISLLDHAGLPGMIYDSRASLILAYLIRALPFASLALIPAMRSVPLELEELAILEGAGLFRRFVSVIIPLTWRWLAVAWFLAFVLSMTDMGASFLVTPPGHSTLTIRFFTLIHYGVYPDAAGICLILILIVSAATLAMGLLSRAALRKQHGNTE